ncbi:unnamed protein product [Prorocentrum cordatum]|uniref:Galectin n=1 Tax=Prorocentrum cordatum TaxID=2364126 RepID=A0ABN9U4H4_9DINO|nr:unnamed protein product [Polarella glacialis]
MWMGARSCQTVLSLPLRRSRPTSTRWRREASARTPDDSCIVQLRLRCPSVATAARIDSHNVGNDEAYNIDMSNEISKRVSAVCRYENPYWTRLPRMRYYEIVLERNVTFQGDVLVHMPSFEGVCDKVLIDGAKSFECRTRVDEPKVTFYSSQHQASLYLLDNEAGTTLRMQNGIPMPIKLPEDADNYQFKLQFGHDEHIYPLRLYMPPMCNKSNLECPEGQGPKEESMSAIEHMCHSTECSTEVDAPLCCGDRDSCDHYTGGCKRHTILRFDAADTLCEITVCHDWDQDTCCAALARCDTYSPSGPDAMSTRRFGTTAETSSAPGTCAT